MQTALISVAVNDTWADTATARSLALQNLGLMRVSTPDVLAGLEHLVRHPHPEIRRQAIWALGEVSRDMIWDKDAQTILSTLTGALQRSRTQLDAEYIIDAIIKLYSPHVHNVEEDLSLLRKCKRTTHRSVKRLQFYLLEREIQSIPVLLRVMGEHLTGSIDELYTSDLALIRYIERNRGALSASPQYRKQIQEVLTKDLNSLVSNIKVFKCSACGCSPILPTTRSSRKRLLYD